MTMTPKEREETLDMMFAVASAMECIEDLGTREDMEELPDDVIEFQWRFRNAVRPVSAVYDGSVTVLGRTA